MAVAVINHQNAILIIVIEFTRFKQTENLLIRVIEAILNCLSQRGSIAGKDTLTIHRKPAQFKSCIYCIIQFINQPMNHSKLPLCQSLVTLELFFPLGYSGSLRLLLKHLTFFCLVGLLVANVVQDEMRSSKCCTLYSVDGHFLLHTCFYSSILYWAPQLLQQIYVNTWYVQIEQQLQKWLLSHFCQCQLQLLQSQALPLQVRVFSTAFLLRSATVSIFNEVIQLIHSFIYLSKQKGIEANTNVLELFIRCTFGGFYV